MGRRRVTRDVLLLELASLLEEEGILHGQELPRDFMDDAIIATCQVGPDSVQNYITHGRALGYWVTNPKHGRGGRGTITFLGTQHEGAVAVT